MSQFLCLRTAHATFETKIFWQCIYYLVIEKCPFFQKQNVKKCNITKKQIFSCEVNLLERVNKNEVKLEISMIFVHLSGLFNEVDVSFRSGKMCNRVR